MRSEDQGFPRLLQTLTATKTVTGKAIGDAKVPKFRPRIVDAGRQQQLRAKIRDGEHRTLKGGLKLSILVEVRNIVVTVTDASQSTNSDSLSTIRTATTKRYWVDDCTIHQHECQYQMNG